MSLFFQHKSQGSNGITVTTITDGLASPAYLELREYWSGKFVACAKTSVNNNTHTFTNLGILGGYVLYAYHTTDFSKAPRVQQITPDSPTTPIELAFTGAGESNGSTASSKLSLVKPALVGGI